jgi:hypothetical protein
MMLFPSLLWEEIRGFDLPVLVWMVTLLLTTPFQIWLMRFSPLVILLIPLKMSTPSQASCEYVMPLESQKRHLVRQKS